MAISSKQVFFIVGPTAVGKSDVALFLAQKINGEILSCDSMQIYKEITIASNKPTEEELAQIPHHLIDIVSIADRFDVAQFNRLARICIEDILERGKVPIVVGGSGMYMQVLVDGIFEGAPTDEKLREKLMKDLEEQGSSKLYERLCALDPKAAEVIHPHNTKRLIRALEVCLTQNKKFSDLKKNRSGLGETHEVVLYCLDQERDVLYAKINDRVEEMFNKGLVDEVKEMLHTIPSQTADVLIGIKEVRGYLQGEYDLAQAKYLMKRNTRHFAKRQLTWFRKDKRLRWIKRQDSDSVDDIVQHILKDVHV